MIEREDMQAFNISTLRIQQGRSANVSSHSILIGGAIVRNNVHPVLAGEGGECLINGLFIGNGRQHLDNYMLVEHASPHCASRQFYNGILDNQSHGVFHGRIIVHKDAQKTDAKQTNRNLGPIAPRAAEPNRMIRTGWTLSTVRRTSSSRMAGSGFTARSPAGIPFPAVLARSFRSASGRLRTMIAGSIRPRQAELVSDPAFSNTVPLRHRMRREAVMPPKSNPALSLRSIIAVTRGQLTFAQLSGCCSGSFAPAFGRLAAPARAETFFGLVWAVSPGVSLGGRAALKSG